ncbi:MAG: hypothetical protein CMF48_03100 [Legionellales bacterium]|nr:hypothetical protein [Legionellales bacterium]
MKSVSHDEQKRMWEKEHRKPYVLLPMDSNLPSSGVRMFWDWLLESSLKTNALRGVEMGCGKGRNCMLLASHAVKMTGFDFSKSAIKEATKRAAQAKINNIDFIVSDATKSWPFESNQFDFAVDCFASTDIESEQGRAFARNELLRVIKPGGYFFIYTLSTDDEFHKEMIKTSPSSQKNSFTHPTTGKFEKVFERDELISLYSDFTLIHEKRVQKNASFHGKEYKCSHFWMIFQK